MDFFGLFLILRSYILKCSGGTIHSQIRATFPEIRQNYCRVLTLSFETQNLSLPNACLNNLREFFSFSFIGQGEPSSIFRGIKKFGNQVTYGLVLVSRIRMGVRVDFVQHWDQRL